MKRLRYFLQIAAAGSLGQASRNLGIAQPALGRQMHLLEQELGAKLFHRMAKGMRLTEEGEYLRDNIQHPLDQAKIVLDNVRSYAKRVESTCTLGLSQSIALMLAPPLIRRLNEEMPNLKLSIVEDRPRHLATELRRGTIDVAILPGAMPDEQLFHAHILVEPLLLIGRRDADFAGKEIIKFSEIEKYPLILPRHSETVALMLEKLSARTNGRISVAYEVDSAALALELVSAGSGYAILPARILDQNSNPSRFAAVEVVEPRLEQGVHFAVQSHWRIARGVYNRFHQLFYDEWMKLVDTGQWRARWIFDRARIAESAA